MRDDIDILGDGFYEQMHSLLKNRVSEKRLLHIEGVASTAEELANRYGVDPKKARLAGLLHDWDKGYDDDQERERVEELGMSDELDPWVVENMPRVLHGPTAARYLEKEYPSIPKDIIDAIYKHTTADSNMSDLDKIIYIADAIEPTRRFDSIDYLRSDLDSISLDDLYLRIYKFWIIALIDHDTVLYPKTIEIWNDLAKTVRSSGSKHGSKKAHKEKSKRKSKDGRQH